MPRACFRMTTRMNLKEFLAWNRRDIWSLSDCNGIRTYNHIVLNQSLNHVDKLANWPVWLDGRVFVYELSGCGLEFRCSHI